MQNLVAVQKSIQQLSSPDDDEWIDFLFGATRRPPKELVRSVYGKVRWCCLASSKLAADIKNILQQLIYDSFVNIPLSLLPKLSPINYNQLLQKKNNNC